MFGSAGCSLPDIIQEIAKEDEEKHKRHQRRIVAKQDRLKSRPPRLGKHKYVSFLVKDIIYLDLSVLFLSFIANWLWA